MSTSPLGPPTLLTRTCRRRFGVKCLTPRRSRNDLAIKWCCWIILTVTVSINHPLRLSLSLALFFSLSLLVLKCCNAIVVNYHKCLFRSLRIKWHKPSGFWKLGHHFFLLLFIWNSHNWSNLVRQCRDALSDTWKEANGVTLIRQLEGLDSFGKSSCSNTWNSYGMYVTLCLWWHGSLILRYGTSCFACSFMSTVTLESFSLVKMRHMTWDA